MSALDRLLDSSETDLAHEHRSVRRGRERGCWVYIPAVVLREQGVDTTKPPPSYRIWPGRKKTVLVQLYEREEEA
jgi:hypothetical protein